MLRTLTRYHLLGRKKNIIHEINELKSKNIDRKKYFDGLNNKKHEAAKFSNFVQK